MQITFGKCDGKTSQEVVVKHGAYTKWVLDQAVAGSALGRLQTDVKRLIAMLDAKVHTGKCSYPGCVRSVVKLTAYDNNDADLYSWCDLCDPYSLGVFVCLLH